MSFWKNIFFTYPRDMEKLLVSSVAGSWRLDYLIHLATHYIYFVHQSTTYKTLWMINTCHIITSEGTTLRRLKRNFILFFFFLFEGKTLEYFWEWNFKSDKNTWVLKISRLSGINSFSILQHAHFQNIFSLCLKNIAWWEWTKQDMLKAILHSNK